MSHSKFVKRLQPAAEESGMLHMYYLDDKLNAVVMVYDGYTNWIDLEAGYAYNQETDEVQPFTKEELDKLIEEESRQWYPEQYKMAFVSDFEPFTGLCIADVRRNLLLMGIESSIGRSSTARGRVYRELVLGS